MVGQGKFNDLGKVKLNVNQIELEVDWGTVPAKIKSISLKQEVINALKTQFGDDEAKIYLDVTKQRGKGYARQRFLCGTSSNLNNLVANCLEGNGSELKKSFEPSAKFMVNIVNVSDDKKLFRRSPALYTTEGEDTDMFLLSMDPELGEMPYKVVPPQINEGATCTIYISSDCFNLFNDNRDSPILKHIFWIIAFRTTLKHIVEQCHDDSSLNPLNDSSFSPWVNWIKDVLRINKPTDYVQEDLDKWMEDSISEFAIYYTIGSNFKRGLKEVFGDD